MPRTIVSPLALFALYALGVEAVSGYVLGSSSGLSEMHKTVLVGFLVGFPLLTLLVFIHLAAREARRDSEAELAVLEQGPAAFRRAQGFGTAE